jgi:hypothetical protein
VSDFGVSVGRSLSRDLRLCFPHDSEQEMDKKGKKRSRPASSNDKNPRPYKRQQQKLQDARKIAVQSSSPGYP